MKKWLIIIISSYFLVFLGGVFVVFIYLPYKWNSMNRNYMERITSIKFPDGTKTIQTNDNGESVTMGKFQLKSSAIEPFLNSLPFDTLDDLDLFQFKNKYFLLSDKNQPRLADHRDYRFFNDCKPGNSWAYLLEIETGELWVEVQYPDMSGDPPGCSKKE